MISSSRSVVKTDNTGMVQAYVPPVQTLELPQEEKWVFPSFIKSIEIPQKIQKQEEVFQEEEQEDKLPEPEEIDEPEVVKEAMKRAEEILQEAEKVRKEAQEEAVLEKQKAMELGYQEGFEWGRKEGCQKALEEYEAKLSEEWGVFQSDMEKALVSVEEAKAKCINTYLEELKDCAIAVGEKVIHISLQSSGSIMKRMIIAETAKLKKKAWVRIYMGKTDYDMLMQADEDVVSELSRLSDHIKFVVINKEKRGDCIIEMPDEVIDISVDTQMENIRKMLENVR